MTPAEWYHARITEWTGHRDAAAARGATLSRLRLASFLGGAAVLWWGLARHQPVATLAGIAGFIAFAVLVVVHARVLERVERAETGRRLGTHGLARLARDWKTLPEVPAPSELDLDAHPYARDLDVFGHASLAKWLGRPATIHGARRLWEWLLGGAEPGEIRMRQPAIEELAAKREWREALAIEGQLTTLSPAELVRFLEWAESDRQAVPGAIQGVSVLIPPATVILFGLFATGLIEDPWWLIPLAAAILLSLGFAYWMHSTFDRVSLGERAMRRYAAMLSLVCHESWTSAEVVRLRQAMCAGGEAPEVLSKLARLSGWSELRRGSPIVHFAVQAVTLWDFHVYFAFHRWRARDGRHVRGWIEALGSVDALATLAMIRADQPAWTTPRVDPAAASLRAAALGHPLLPDDRRVANDVEVGPRETLLLITGSNMSGKSTLLRAIGLNAVLAQAGAPACAAAFEMPPADLHTSIRVEDSLELGLSYFMAALARLKQIVDAAERGVAPGRALLYLLDEVLQGTNSVERGIAVRAVVRHLLDARAIGVMTTHDLAIADEEPIKSAARLAHFTEQVHPDGTMTFDYRLRPGLATSTNALRLMQLIGITPR
jgi:MutS-like protein